MINFAYKKTIILSALLTFSAIGGAAEINQPVYLSATGDNANDGLTEATAWKTITKLNSQEFGPGAQILFKRGETFSGSLTLQGSGSAAQPIIIGAYGSGDKPLLTGKWDEAEVIELTSGNEYIEFENLQLSNYNINNLAIEERYGIHILAPAGSGEMNHLHFSNLDFLNIQGSGKAVHEDDHRSAGIIALTTNDDVNGSRFNDVLIEGSTFTDIDGLGVLLKDMSQDITDFRKDSTPYFPTVGLVFKNNEGLNIYRNLLMIRGTKDALVERNTMDTTVEGSAFWSFATEGTVVQFNVFKHLRASDADAYVCHFDYNNKDTLMQYNIGYDVEGGLIEYIVNSELANAFQENGIARYNIGIDVGYRDKNNGAGILLTGRVTGGQFYNNTIVQLTKPMTNGISFSDWGGAWPLNNEIYNNIFYAAGDHTVAHNQPTRFDNLGNVVSNNLYAGNISAPATWDNIITDINPITGDPKFVNPAGLTAEDFMITSGSDAIAQGLIIANNGGLDYFGNTVSASEAPSLGAHEFAVTSITSSDDAHIRMKKVNDNNGDSESILLRKNTNSNEGFMKFIVDTSRDVQSATLALYAVEAGHIITIRAVSDNTWQESTITANNAPLMADVIATAPSLVAGQYVEFDLSNYISSPGTYSIGITTDSSKNVELHSKEATQNQPILTLSY